EIVAEILKAAAHLQLIFDAVDNCSVDAGRGPPPGGGNQAVVELRPLDAVELRRLVMLINVSDRHEIDAGRPPVEPIGDKEIDEDLLDIDRAVQLVIRIECDAAVLEFDFRIENDVGSDCVGRQQDQAMRIEAVLPLAAGGGVLNGTELDLAVGPDAEAGNGRFGGAEGARVLGAGASGRRGPAGQGRQQLLLGACGLVGRRRSTRQRGQQRRCRSRFCWSRGRGFGLWRTGIGAVARCSSGFARRRNGGGGGGAVGGAAEGVLGAAVGTVAGAGILGAAAGVVLGSVAAGVVGCASVFGGSASVLSGSAAIGVGVAAGSAGWAASWIGGLIFK